MSTEALRGDLLWSLTREEDRRFKRILAQTLACSLLLGVITPLIRFPTPEVTVEDQSPLRYVRLLPPAAVPASPPEQAAPAAGGVSATIAPPSRQTSGKPDESPAATAPLQPAAEPARGIDAALSRLRMWEPAPAADARGARIQVEKAVSPRNPSVIAEEVTRGSGGAPGELPPLAILGPGVLPATGQGAETVQKGSRQASGAVSPDGSGVFTPVRSQWEIQEVLDRHKGSIYTLYNRELRHVPDLQGKLVLSVTIDAAGRVTRCRILDSDLDSSTLEKELLTFIRQIDFGNKPGAPVVTTKVPIEFFPR